MNPSKATKTGLPNYKDSDGKDIFAARITQIIPMNSVFPGAPEGAMILKFGDDGKKANLIPLWIAEHKPVVNGYFIVEDGENGIATGRHLAKTQFDEIYKKDKIDKDKQNE